MIRYKLVTQDYKIRAGQSNETVWQTPDGKHPQITRAAAKRKIDFAALAKQAMEEEE